MKIFSFSGRARRSETLTLLFIYAILNGIYRGAAAFIWGDATRAPDIVALPAIIVFFFLYIILLASLVRRMHDINKSGWFAIIPFVNFILSLFPGTPGPNRFGPDPRNPEAKESQHPAQVNQHLPQQRVSQHGTRQRPVQQGRNIPGL
ncbi:MAG: DUF805 domain-containing protein [Pseudomonadota bacterium]|nr:DUF805 domain-containing protein [Pseudomonadota bacterium]